MHFLRISGNTHLQLLCKQLFNTDAMAFRMQFINGLIHPNLFTVRIQARVE